MIEFTDIARLILSAEEKLSGEPAKHSKKAYLIN